MPSHLEVTRHIIEHLGNVFAERTHMGSAFGTVTSRGRMNQGLTWEVVGKRAWFAATSNGLVCFLRIDRFAFDGQVCSWNAQHLLYGQISKGQFELIHQLSHTLR
ncbi:hypothetical protein AWB67_06143 [Caballeronia terrestris]|uniref:Uncharacterized protein n=2 Tax=Caballeronia TaxID=1827195 RepID=A0A158KMU2_9BURK|nr:hypothetical protein AWB67_06143 [Caballeronia terrestris]